MCKASNRLFDEARKPGIEVRLRENRLFGQLSVVDYGFWPDPPLGG